MQLDHYEEREPMREMCGTMDAELEVRCTIKRAELAAFLCFFEKDYRLHHGTRGQQKNHRWVLDKRNEVHWP